jgi:hypothetical protein
MTLIEPFDRLAPSRRLFTYLLTSLMVMDGTKWRCLLSPSLWWNRRACDRLNASKLVAFGHLAGLSYWSLSAQNNWGQIMGRRKKLSGSRFLTQQDLHFRSGVVGVGRFLFCKHFKISLEAADQYNKGTSSYCNMKIRRVHFSIIVCMILTIERTTISYLMSRNFTYL